MGASDVLACPRSVSAACFRGLVRTAPAPPLSSLYHTSALTRTLRLGFAALPPGAHAESSPAWLRAVAPFSHPHCRELPLVLMTGHALFCNRPQLLPMTTVVYGRHT